MAEEQSRQANDIDTIILGKTTYDILSAYWPTSAAEGRDLEMFKHLNNAIKIVFSTTLKIPQQNNSKVMPSISYEAIQSIKQGEGRNIAVSGSASVVHALLNLGLIGEFHLMIFPVTAGCGKRLFENFTKRQNFSLTKTTPFSNGVVALHYKCKK